MDHLSHRLNEVPPPPDNFRGRLNELQLFVTAIRAAVIQGNDAVCVIRGMTGIGKTALAQMVAQACDSKFPDLFPGGMVWLDLQGSSETPLATRVAMQRIIARLRPSVPIPDDDVLCRQIYHDLLRQQRVLIVADDARDAEHIEALIPPQGSALLITSRRRFRVPRGNVAETDLEGLSPSHAIDVLLSIEPAIWSREKREQAATLAALCDYLPLALSVAAALIKNQRRHVGDFIASLQAQRERGRPSPDDPLQILAPLLGLSLTHLDQRTRDGLYQLSVFPSAFNAATAAAILDGVQDVDALIGSLCELHLLAQVGRDRQRTSSARPHYRMHDLVRLFAIGQGEQTTQAQHRHAAYYAEVVRRAAERTRNAGLPAVDMLYHIDLQNADIRQGWQWAKNNRGVVEADTLYLSYAAALLPFMGRYYEPSAQVDLLAYGQELAERAGDTRLRMQLLTALAKTYGLLNDADQLWWAAELACELARAHNAFDNEAQALLMLADYCDRANAPGPALQYYGWAEKAAEQANCHELRCTALTQLGAISMRCGSWRIAESYFDQASALAPFISYDTRVEVALLREIGVANMWLAFGVGFIGRTLAPEIYYQRAAAHLQKALRLAALCIDTYGGIIILKTLAALETMAGNEVVAYMWEQTALALEVQSRQLDAAADAAFLETVLATIEQT